MKEFLKLAGTLFIITFVAAALLCGVNAMTAEQIRQNEIEKSNKAMQAILTSAESFTETDNENISVGTAGEETVGYCVTVDAPGGYGGDISMMVGFNADGSVAGIDILSHGETAGLGANCDTDDFKARLAGKIYPVEAFKGVAVTDSQFQAITGATITSNAIARGVNNAYEILQDAGLLEGGVK